MITRLFLAMALVGPLVACVPSGSSSQRLSSLNDPVLACPGQLSRAQRIAIEINNSSADSTTDQIKPRCR